MKVGFWRKLKLKRLELTRFSGHGIWSAMNVYTYFGFNKCSKIETVKIPMP